MSINKNTIVVLDGSIGSVGKGKVVGEIATDKSVNLGAAVSNCKPNAGHTFVSNKNEKMVFTNIPVSAVNKKTELFIGPGAAIDMESFIDEYERHKDLLGDRKIYVHEMVPLIEERHRQYEEQHIKSGSTCKGCGAVTADKIMRDENLKFFKGYKNAVVVSINEYLDRLYGHLDNPNEYVMLESSQGCGLDTNYSGNYPNTSGDSVSASFLLDRSGISPERLLETIMAIRPFSIRISNVNKQGKFIYTGGFGSAAPLTWSHINLSAAKGDYPTPDYIDSFNYNIEEGQIEFLLRKSTDIALKQVLGENYSSITASDVSAVDALELERLIHKSKGQRRYKSFITNGYIIDLSEETTITRMERRVGDLDIKQLINYCRINTPYGIYLNFFQQMDLIYKGARGNFDEYHFGRWIKEYLKWLEDQTGTDILALGTGARNRERILKKELIKR